MNNVNKFRIAILSIFVDDVIAYYQFLKKYMGFQLIQFITEDDFSVNILMAVNDFKVKEEEEHTGLLIRIVKRTSNRLMPEIVFGMCTNGIDREEGIKILKDKNIKLHQLPIGYSIDHDTYMDDNGNCFSIEPSRYSEIEAINNIHLKGKYGIEISRPDAIEMQELPSYFAAFFKEITLLVSSPEKLKDFLIDITGFQLIEPVYSNNVLQSFKIFISASSDMFLHVKKADEIQDNKSFIEFQLSSKNGDVADIVNDFSEDFDLPKSSFNEHGLFLHNSLKLKDPAGFNWNINN